MLLKLIQNTELKHLTSLVSPSFFTVMPTRQLMSAGKALLGNYRDANGFERTVAERVAHLGSASVPIRLVEEPRDEANDETVGEAGIGEAGSREAGVYAERVVTLYFHQLWHGERAVLDLRASSLIDHEDHLVWSPSPLWTTWEPHFIGPLRQIYQGYYTGDDRLFSEGLRALHLDGAESLFRQQFGENVEATVFELKQFIQSFDAIFNFAKHRKITLHHGFVSLGIYLATMYENLDRLGVEVNVRRCFENGTLASSASHQVERPAHV